MATQPSSLRLGGWAKSCHVSQKWVDIPTISIHFDLIDVINPYITFENTVHIGNRTDIQLMWETAFAGFTSHRRLEKEGRTNTTTVEGEER